MTETKADSVEIPREEVIKATRVITEALFKNGIDICAGLAAMKVIINVHAARGLNIEIEEKKP